MLNRAFPSGKDPVIVIRKKISIRIFEFRNPRCVCLKQIWINSFVQNIRIGTVASGSALSRR